MPRKKLPSRNSIIVKLDAAFSKYIRDRDAKLTNGMCMFSCGRPIECVFHFITRSKHATRWDVDNAVGSCYAQNYENEFNPHPYIKWYLQRNGIEKYNGLVARSNKVAKFSIQDLELLLAGFKDKVSNFP